MLYRASRVAFVLHYGIDVFEMAVCHTCDNPKCVEPTHLFLGTMANNIDDMKQKGRGAQGERMPWHKLTEKDVLEIRDLAAAGTPKAQLARQYNVHYATIKDAVTGRHWKHVGGPLTMGRVHPLKHPRRVRRARPEVV